MLTLVAHLQAHDVTRHLHRFYRIEYGQDLFDDWIVLSTYGRVGCKGRCLTAVFDSQAQALAHIQHLLKRRQSAPRRIGTSYQPLFLHEEFALMTQAQLQKAMAMLEMANTPP